MVRSLVIILVAVLSACGGGDGANFASATGTNHCGVGVGAQRIEGKVTSVHDGDTITVGGESIRLGSIDAPELDQAYGPSSRTHLANLILGQDVLVTYAQKDIYGRVVGTVFKSNCSLVNLNQVASGAAWYYEAYKCEIDAGQHQAYASAHAAARTTKKGLWATAAVAPWVYRNGADAKVPDSCPNWDGDLD